MESSLLDVEDQGERGGPSKEGEAESWDASREPCDTSSPLQRLVGPRSRSRIPRPRALLICSISSPASVGAVGNGTGGKAEEEDEGEVACGFQSWGASRPWHDHEEALEVDELVESVRVRVLVNLDELDLGRVDC